MKVFYHNDPDGELSAWVIKYKVIDNHHIVYDNSNITLEQSEFIKMDYDKEVPIDRVQDNELVFIVDFSFSVADMDRLYDKTKYIVWIDHHKTAIEKFAGTIYENIRGVRSMKYSGCVLTWMWFEDGNNQAGQLQDRLKKDSAKKVSVKEVFDKVPEFIKLVGDYDNWNWWFKDETARFYAGIFIRNRNPYQKNNIWDLLICENSKYPENQGLPSLLNKIKNDGSVILKYRQYLAKDFCENTMYSTVFHGYKTCVANAVRTGSKFFDSVKDEYDIAVTWVYKGEKYYLSIYALNNDVDVSEIAKKYGGGGHAGAAGAIFEELPEKLMKKI